MNVSRSLRSLQVGVGAGLAVLLVAANASAVTTRVFSSSTVDQFNLGTLDKSMVSSLGVVSSGWDVARSEIPAGLVWSSTEAPDGTVYLGSGNRGEIYAVRGTKVVPFARVDAVVVTSLVVANGRLYAGTMPQGKVFEVTLGSDRGQARELCKLSAEHIWALRFDGRRGTLYAATGPNGKLFAIEPGSGKNRVAYESGEKHLLSLVGGPDGSLYIGSADKAVVIRFDPRTGKSVAVHDFDGDEIRGLAMRGDNLFIAVNKFDKPRAVPASQPTYSGSRRPMSFGGERSSGSSAPVSSADRKGKGWVWQIDGEGRAEMLYALSDSYLTAIDVDSEGSVYVGTGAKGRVLMIRPDRTAFTAFEFRERQVLTLSMGKNPVIGTADAGAVYRLTGRRPRSAMYTSRVFDASFASRWGNIFWRGTGTLVMETRTGNTARPDKTWSSFVKAGSQPPSRIASPPGRYLQYRVRWEKDPNAELREVQVYYLNQNQRPRVETLAIGPAPPPKGQEPQPAMLKLVWRVDNPDGDDLVYRVYYRADDEPNWKLLTRPDPLTKMEYIWNTESVPHGVYRVKVTASDERSNPPGAALVHERISPPLLVDNGKPEVVDLRVKFPDVSGRARDGQSRISRLDYAIDGGEWIFFYPKDGIFDDKVEPFAFRIGDKLNVGQHTLAVRAHDAAGNLGTSQVTFTIR